MFKIGKLFHLTHVVSDLKAVDKWYDDIFAVTRYYHGFAKAAGRDASLIAIGNVIMEPMTPSKVEGLRNQSVKRFHDRFGEHFHSIAFYVDDVPAISTHLANHNLKMWDVTGRPVTPPNEKFAVWTHPRETPGQLEFAIIERNTIDPRLQPAWSNEFWRERHPLGIEHASHITTVVKDLGAAKKFYCDVLGGKCFHEHETASRKRSAFVAVGEDTVVELAQPNVIEHRGSARPRKEWRGRACADVQDAQRRARLGLPEIEADETRARWRFDLDGPRAMLRDGDRIHGASDSRRPSRQLIFAEIL